MSAQKSNLQSLRYTSEGGLKLSVLDQLLLPTQKKYVDIYSAEDAWGVIRSMQIRGAPLIAIVACLGLSVDLATNETTVAELDALAPDDELAIIDYVQRKMDYLRTSRPTAVNLFNALDELTATMNIAGSSADGTDMSARERIVQSVISHAEFMLKRDVGDNEAIGVHGADALLNQCPRALDGLNIVTICNTGSLATAGFGTALGVVRELQRRNKLKSITALETRPYNQGSRLTAFEIVEEDMPGGLLICDSMAAALMKTKGADACVVGADRVCANGDTANKIGTYQLAIVAAAHGVPFYVASPFTTLDTKLASGDDIEIEERPEDELITSSQAPPNIRCWNPAFDVTPANYIAGIITEKGVIEKGEDGTFDISGFIKKQESSCVGKTDKKHSAVETVLDQYTEQTIESLPLYIANHAPEAMEAMSATSFVDLDCEQVGDGDLNLLFVVTNTLNEKKVFVKQALPYIRSARGSWPLTLERAWYQYKALSAQNVFCPGLVPVIYHFSKVHALNIMQYIPPPNMVFRKGLISGTRYATMATDMGHFAARTLFKSSGFKLSAKQLRKEVEFWSKNSDMCALTEQVVFTEPYINASTNRWTQCLYAEKKSIESDTTLKIAASKLKGKFVSQTQALLHANLNVGSVICSPEATFVIDPESAFYGPFGYDVGSFIASLLLAYVSQSGHDNVSEYSDWLLFQVILFWSSFVGEFMKLWNDPLEHVGDLFKRDIISDEDAIKIAQEDFIGELLHDSLGFAGMKMLRWIVGTTHVEDLESIKDDAIKAHCEKHGLAIARELIKNSAAYSSIEDAAKMAQKKGEDG